MNIRKFQVGLATGTFVVAGISGVAHAANNNAYFPSSQAFGTVMFEDQFPCEADYDFNDLVLEYNATVTTDSSSGDIRYLVWNTRIVAVGGRINNGFGVELPYTNSQILSVSGATWENNGASEKVVLRMFENAHAEYGADGSLNTMAERDEMAPVERAVVVTFNSNVSSLGTPPYNPFAFRSDSRAHEIHLAGESSTVNGIDFDGVCDVDTDYKTLAGLPFGIHISAQFGWPIENARLDIAYPELVAWASSGGLSNTNWNDAPAAGQTLASSLADMCTLGSSSYSYTATGISVQSSDSTAATNAAIAAQIAIDFAGHPQGTPVIMDWRDIEAMTASELAIFMTTSPTTAFVTKDGDIDLYAGRPYFIRRIEGYTNSGAAIHDAVWLDLNDPTSVSDYSGGSVSFPDTTGKRGIWLGSWKGARPALVAW